MRIQKLRERYQEACDAEDRAARSARKRGTLESVAEVRRCMADRQRVWLELQEAIKGGGFYA